MNNLYLDIYVYFVTYGQKSVKIKIKKLKLVTLETDNLKSMHG